MGSSGDDECGLRWARASLGGAARASEWSLAITASRSAKYTDIYSFAIGFWTRVAEEAEE